MAEPAFRGFVETTLDALLVFEGCRRGQLGKITRRLQEVEKRRLIVSGAVFVFDEEQTGIKRWTDGLTWSPSRTLGNFLVYRELDKKGGPQLSLDGSWDDAANILLPPPTPGSMMDRPPSQQQLDQPASSSYQSSSSSSITTEPNPTNNSLMNRPRSESDSTGLSLDRARERALVGSLTSSYRFRSDGLVKKTISLSKLHMIGYYKIEDVTSGRLRTPSSMPELFSLEISPQFLSPTYFRLPPVTEAGPDGKLRYKSEAEPASNTPGGMGGIQLIRQDSNPQREVIALPPAQSRSRPASSSSSNRPNSPRSSQREAHQLGTPGSPHRANSGNQRSSAHYHPYNVPRTSPNLTNYGQPSYGYPSQAGSRPSPPLAARSSFPILSGSAEESYATHEQSGLSPALGMMSTSNAAYDNNWGTGASFYQPRHPTPYSTEPSPSGVPSQAQSSAIFAYEAPPIGPHSRSHSHQPQQPQRARASPSPQQPVNYTYRPSHSAHGPPQPTFAPQAPVSRPPLHDPSRAYAPQRFVQAQAVNYQARDELEETVPPSNYSNYAVHSPVSQHYTPYNVPSSAQQPQPTNFGFIPQARAHQPSGMVIGLQGSPTEEDDDKRELVGGPPSLGSSNSARGAFSRTNSEGLAQSIKREGSQGPQAQWWPEQAQAANWANPPDAQVQTGLGLPLLQPQGTHSPAQAYQQRPAQQSHAQPQTFNSFRPQESWQ